MRVEADVGVELFLGCVAHRICGSTGATTVPQHICNTRVIHRQYAAPAPAAASAINRSARVRMSQKTHRKLLKLVAARLKKDGSATMQGVVIDLIEKAEAGR